MSDLRCIRPLAVWLLPAFAVQLACVWLAPPLARAASRPKSPERAEQSVPWLRPARTGTLAARDFATGRDSATGTAAWHGPPRIRLAAGFEFAPAEGLPAVPPEPAATTPGRPGHDRGLASYIVQFAATPGPQELAAVTRAGGGVFAYVPDHAYLVRMSDEARARLAAAGVAAWIGDYRPAYKLSPMAVRSATEPRLFTALLFPDAEVPALRARLAAFGVEIAGASDNGVNKMLHFRARGDALERIAAHSEVAWIEPVLPVHLCNDNAQWVVQTAASGNRRVWQMGLAGEGQIVMTSDSGIETTHDQFVDPALPITDFGDYPSHRKVVGYRRGSDSPGIEFGDHPGATYHGTHTACTLMGSDGDDPDTSPLDGMAKNARIYFMDISGSLLGSLVAPPADLNDLFLPAYLGNAAGGARVSSNSWASDAAGAYTLHSFTLDQFAWSHPDFYIAFANGNAGTLGSVGSPATAKNAVGAGGTGNGSNAGQFYVSTSRGPTQDARRKPTFCSPGENVQSAAGEPSFGYRFLSGTSMASPTGAGAVTLMRQYLTDGWYPSGAPVAAHGFSPSAALLKAMAVNAASNTVFGFTAPDFNVGWGRVCADSVLYFAGDVRKLLLVDHREGLGHGEFIEYEIHVVDSSMPLEVTLCWTDYPGNPAAAVQLVNNLDLTVTRGAAEYRGNVFQSGVSVTGGTYDARNVEENVRIANPATGIWTVRVEAPAVPLGPQPFALCITGGVGSGAGALALDRAEYGSTGTMHLEVVDANAGGSVTVSVVSATETTPEVVTLVGGDGLFSGSLALSTASSSPNDGMLSVSDGDAVTATYQDASPAATMTAQATVSLDMPAITNVGAVSQGPTASLVSWTTDRSASSRVYYGLTPALEHGYVEAAGATLGHQVLLSGLTAGATYYFDVESVSLSGNATRDDLGGAHYRFTAKAPGEVLLVLGQDGFPRAFAWEDALRTNGYDYDVWTEALADQPVLGHLATGLRSYRAVLWQPGLEQYPPFSDGARDTITAYLDGGGRLAISGHDIAWSYGYPFSPEYTPERKAWLENTLKAVYLADPFSWTSVLGVTGDPISGSYGAVPYTPFRNGGAGDEVDMKVPSGGAAQLHWRNNDGTPDSIALRWESATPNGSAAAARWGGQPSRLVAMFFEFTALAPPHDLPSTTRNGILERTLVWLFGRDRPTVSLTSLTGGQTVTSPTVAITWNETVGAGHVVVSRVLEFSLDGGSSWNALASGVGPSPYVWNLSGTPNTGAARVRIRNADDGAPALGAVDASDADIRIERPGGDAQGPVVSAGTIAASPNPVVRPNPATLAARVTDQATGAGTVAAAEWSFGNAPAAAGGGAPMTGPFGTGSADVTATLDTSPFLVGAQKLWVRARDATGNWGPASSLGVQVNGPSPVGLSDLPPTIAFLARPMPNPFNATTRIRFGLPARGSVELSVYDVQGRRVRRLAHGIHEAGVHEVAWTGRDEHGGRVRAGVYFCRLVTPGARLDRRMVVLR